MGERKEVSLLVGKEASQSLSEVGIGEREWRGRKKGRPLAPVWRVRSYPPVRRVRSYPPVWVESQESQVLQASQ